MVYNEKKKFAWGVIALYVAIVLFGWFNIYAAVYDDAHTAVFDLTRQHGKQLLWIGLAWLTAVFILFVEPKVFSNIAYIVYAVVLGLLVITLFIGQVTKGGQSWINFGFFKFQPSEFAKFATALALAKYMSAIDLDIKRFQTKAIAFVIILVPAVLILLQHDTGSALVFASFILPLYREGFPGQILVYGLLAVVLFVLSLLVNKYLVIGIVALLCLAYLFLWLNKRTTKDFTRILFFFALCTAFILSVDFTFEHVLESHQKERIEVLLGKSEDLRGAGYNVHQS